jgi:L-lactate dehydrogenase complex protein LldG
MSDGMSARDQILGTIRNAKASPSADGQTPDAQSPEDRITAKRRGTIPARVDKDHPALVELFVEQATALSATVARVDDAAEVPGAVADYLAGENLPAAVRAAPDPTLQGLPWDTRPALTVSYGRSHGADEVSLTPAFAAVAETGTLMLRSGADHPTTLNFLPDTHVLLLRASQVVGPYEEAWDQLRAAGPIPRAVNFVSGPSRTADIEQTIQLGAHGPRRLHIILIEDGPPAGNGDGGRDGG